MTISSPGRSSRCGFAPLPFTSTLPPLGVNLTALDRRLRTIFSHMSRSRYTRSGSGGHSTIRSNPARSIAERNAQRNPGRTAATAAALGVTPQTVFDYLARGLLSGRQLAKGQPWQIALTDKQIDRLRARLRYTRRSKKEAS